MKLQVTSPANTHDPLYELTGVVRDSASSAGPSPAASDLSLAGVSVRIRSLVTGLMDEAFVDECGLFAQQLELQPESDNALELTVCDGDCRDVGRTVVTIHCHPAGRSADPAPPTQIVAKMVLDPPWPRFAQLVRRCLDLAVEAAKATNRPAEELFEHVYAQERYAEQAFEEQNQRPYQECRENLEKYLGYLDQLVRDALPRPAAPPLPPEVEAKVCVERFREYLATVWKQVRAKQRTDLEARLTEIAGQAHGFTQRMKAEPLAVIRDAYRLGVEVHKIEKLLTESRRPPAGGGAGPLDGTA